MDITIHDPITCYFLLCNEPTIGSIVDLELTIPPSLAGPEAVKIVCQGKVIEVTKEGNQSNRIVVCSIDNYELQPVVKDMECRESRESE